MNGKADWMAWLEWNPPFMVCDLSMSAGNRLIQIIKSYAN